MFSSATSPNAPANEGETLNATHKSVLAFLKKNCELTAQQITDEIGKSKRTVERSIRFQKENGFIKREGSDKKVVVGLYYGKKTRSEKW